MERKEPHQSTYSRYLDEKMNGPNGTGKSSCNEEECCRVCGVSKKGVKSVTPARSVSGKNLRSKSSKKSRSASKIKKTQRSLASSSASVSSEVVSSRASKSRKSSRGQIRKSRSKTDPLKTAIDLEVAKLNRINEERSISKRRLSLLSKKYSASRVPSNSNEVSQSRSRSISKSKPKSAARKVSASRGFSNSRKASQGRSILKIKSKPLVRQPSDNRGRSKSRGISRARSASVLKRDPMLGLGRTLALKNAQKHPPRSLSKDKNNRSARRASFGRGSSVARKVGQSNSRSALKTNQSSRQPSVTRGRSRSASKNKPLSRKASVSRKLSAPRSVSKGKIGSKSKKSSSVSRRKPILLNAQPPLPHVRAVKKSASDPSSKKKLSVRGPSEENRKMIVY